jgi:hypothetical protein
LGRRLFLVLRLTLAVTPGSRISPAGLTHIVGLHATLILDRIIDEAMWASVAVLMLSHFGITLPGLGSEPTVASVIAAPVAVRLTAGVSLWIRSIPC